jgi:hypothetical protein
MEHPDPRLPLRCPTCGNPLRYIATKLSPLTWYLYMCPQDGMFEVPKAGCDQTASFMPATTAHNQSMLPHDAKMAGSGPAIPPCRNCKDNARVRPLTLQWVAEGMQHWACGACGFVWATQDGQPLRSSASPRISA